MSDPAVASPETIIELQGTTKRFPGVLALDRVDLAIRRGEVHVLVGQNGAGKSTLVKLLCGLYAPDEGRILLEGEPYTPKSALTAIRAGIRVVYQEFALLPYLSVAENVYFQRLPRRFGLVDVKRLHADTEALLAEVGLDLSPGTRVETLGVAQMQLLEIAKALSTRSKVLILDEPTATLSPPEIHRLFEIIARLKARGVTILYISHRLQEVFEVGDRITVLRNGRKVETLEAREASVPRIVRLMVGKEMGAEYPFHPEVQPGAEILRVEELRPRGARHAVSFAVRRGEIVGLAGLVGSGRTEAMRALFGADPKESGRIYRDGREVHIGRPRDAVQHGICLLTEDRKAQGLILDMPCTANVTITDLERVSHAGLLRNLAEREATEEQVRDLDIKTPSIDQLVGNLSGGNQQKVVIAKWLFRRAEVLVCDEPTRGIDVGARFEIYELLWRLAAAGKGIVIVSSDLPELMGICHRILVFSNGRLTGDLPRAEFGQERILDCAYQEYIHGRPRAGAGSPPAARPGLGGDRMRATRIFYLLLREVGIGLALVLLILAFSAAAPRFASMANLTNILTQISINTVISVGMTFVILLGGIDLSVGSVLALSTIVGGLLITHEGLTPGTAILLSVVGSTLTGCLCGLFNGVVCERWKIHSFIVTLGMLNIARGAALQISNSRTIFEFPDAFNAVGSAAVLGVPVIFLIALAVVLVGRFVLVRSVFGRLIYAIGNNEEAVRLSGHDPARYKVAAFTVCGGMVGLAAVMYMMRLNIASPILGVGFELNAIAAVVIGGTSMSGGKGSMVGTFLGASIMGVLNNGLLLLGMGDFARQMVTGLIIVVAVIIDKYRAKALVRSSYGPLHAQPAAQGQGGTP